MTIEVRVPQLPESVADATLVSWHKKPGDTVARDENLVDLETDKVVLEVPAPMAGMLKEIRLANGTTVTSGQVLAIIEDGPAAAVPGASAPAILAAANGATTTANQATQDEPGRSGGQVESGGQAGGGREQGGSEGGGGVGSRRSRVEIGRGQLPVDQDAVPAAPAASAAKTAGAAPVAKATAAAPVASAAAAPALNARGARVDQRVPMTRLRARIAERMVQAQSTQALLTSFNEVDLKAVNELRARYKEPFEKQYGVKLASCRSSPRPASRRSRNFPP